MKKRPLFVEVEKYQDVVNLLDKANVKNWNETETFYFHKLTAAIVALIVIAVSVAIGVLN